MRSFPSVVLAGLLVAAALLASVTPSSAADPWPGLRPGSWEFTRTLRSARTVGRPQVIKAVRCTDPVADMKQQNARLARAGCTFTPVVQRGNTYSFSSLCRMAGMEVRSRSVLTVESPTAYRLHVDTVEDGRTGQEDMIARRVGDCRR